MSEMANKISNKFKQMTERFKPPAEVRSVSNRQAAIWGLTGAALMGYGMRRKGMLGSTLAAAGAASIYRAFSQLLPGQRMKTAGCAETVIQQSVPEVFRFCAHLSNLRSILPRTIMSPAPGLPEEEGIRAQVIESREHDLLVWRAVQDECQYVGRMEFHPAYYGRGTSVALSLEQSAGGPAWAGNLQQHAEESLRRLKAVLESHAGEDVFAVGELASDTAEVTGWAPESGEPDERRFGYSRADVSSSFGDDEGFAPESGDRILDRAVDQSLPEPERIEENAQENRVTEGSEESFPASDAPSWTPGRT